MSKYNDICNATTERVYGETAINLIKRQSKGEKLPSDIRIANLTIDNNDVSISKVKNSPVFDEKVSSRFYFDDKAFFYSSKTKDIQEIAVYKIKLQLTTRIIDDSFASVLSKSNVLNRIASSNETIASVLSIMLIIALIGIVAGIIFGALFAARVF